MSLVAALALGLAPLAFALASHLIGEVIEFLQTTGDQSEWHP